MIGVGELIDDGRWLDRLSSGRITIRFKKPHNCSVVCQSVATRHQFPLIESVPTGSTRYRFLARAED